MNIIILACLLYVTSSHLYFLNEDLDISHQVIQELFYYGSSENDQVSRFSNISDTVLVYDPTGELGLDYDGRIVMAPFPFGYDNMDVIMSCGAAVVFFPSQKLAVPGLLSLQVKQQALRGGYSDILSFNVAINKEHQELWESVLEREIELEVVLTDKDNENNWIALTNHWGSYVGQYSVVLYALIIWFLATKKLVLKRKAKNGCHDIDQSEIILFLEGLNNLVRAFHYLVDPPFLRGIIGPLFTLYFLQVTWPISVLTTSMLIITLDRSISLNSILEKIQFPVYVVILVFGFVSVVFYPILLVSGWLKSYEIVYVIIAIYLFFSVGLSVYIFYVAPKVFRLTNEFKGERRNRLKEKAYLVLASGIMTCFWVVGNLTALLIPFTPVTYHLMFYFLYVTLITISLVQILFFDPERPKIQSSNLKSSSFKKKN